MLLGVAKKYYIAIAMIIQYIYILKTQHEINNYAQASLNIYSIFVLHTHSTLIYSTYFVP